MFDDLGSNILVFCWSCNHSEGRLIAIDYVDNLGNQVHPMVQNLFPNNGGICQDNNSPIHTPEVLSFFEEHENALQHLP
jgi:hypothetical protein